MFTSNDRKLRNEEILQIAQTPTSADLIQNSENSEILGKSIRKRIWVMKEEVLGDGLPFRMNVHYPDHQ
jgi:hypothetical protein